jgi:anti-sigma B factor antagonist
LILKERDTRPLTTGEQVNGHSLSRIPSADDGVILAVVGEIDLSNAEEFVDEVRSLVGGAEGEVVLSLQNLRFIDSIGIGALYMLARELRTQSQTLVLSGLDDQPRRVLELTGLLDGGGPFEIRDAALSPGNARSRNGGRVRSMAG